MSLDPGTTTSKSCSSEVRYNILLSRRVTGEIFICYF